jgi:methylenetetrahydrofolate reductase (NADPH)
MRIDELFATKKCVFALEVFPPKKQSGVESVYRMLNEIKACPADYISVTYSAGGGGAKELTARSAGHVKTVLGTEPLAHLTCVNARRDEISRELTVLRATGVQNILALRGDRNPDGSVCKDYAYACDLVSEVAAAGGFYIVGACYPEGHPESSSLAMDIENLRRKLDAGAGHFVSQMFFDNSKFYRFLNLARKHRIACPIEAGIMPVVKPEQISRVVALSSASLPADFSKWVSRFSDDPFSFYEAGIDYAIRQIRDLIESGADGIHLYAMNNAQVTARIRGGIADLL